MNGNQSPRVPEKTLVIYPDKAFPTMLKVKFKEGGKIPEVLSGMYNGRTEAQRAIDYYIEGITRNKIYPKPPTNDIPQRIPPDGEAKNTG